MKMMTLLLLALMIPLTQAVIFGNGTQVFESTNGSHIRFEQDTVMEQLTLDSVNGQIIMDNVSTFNSTYTSLKTTDYSVVLFLDILNKTGQFGNGTSFVTTTLADYKLLIEGNDTFTWLDYTVPIVIAATDIIFIYPDTNNTVIHIILGRRLLF